MDTGNKVYLVGIFKMKKEGRKYTIKTNELENIVCAKNSYLLAYQLAFEINKRNIAKTYARVVETEYWN